LKFKEFASIAIGGVVLGGWKERKKVMQSDIDMHIKELT